MGSGLLGRRSPVAAREGGERITRARNDVPGSHAAHTASPSQRFIQAVGDCVQPRNGEGSPQTQHACCKLRCGSESPALTRVRELATRRTQAPRSETSQRRAPRQPRQPATARSMRPTSSWRARRAMTGNRLWPRQDGRWPKTTTGHTKAVCAACSEVIPTKAWRARARRAGARVWTHPARLPEALPHGTRQG